jgi:hypothetical protein
VCLSWCLEHVVQQFNFGIGNKACCRPVFSVHHSHIKSPSQRSYLIDSTQDTLSLRPCYLIRRQYTVESLFGEFRITPSEEVAWCD